MTQIQQIHKIAAVIRKNGKLVNQAKSAWGADRWEWGNCFTTLEDEGYTVAVGSNGFCVSETCDRVNVRNGNINDLQIMYENLVK